MNKTYKARTDGFGSHYKSIIVTYAYCKWKKYNFIYRPLTNIAHNYNNDPDFIQKLENLINIKPYLQHISNNCDFEIMNDKMILRKIKENPNILENAIEDIRKYFWENKELYYLEYSQFTNIAIHIRRPNSGDVSWCPPTITSFTYYLNLMKKMKSKYKNIKFHIYSQGDMNDFDLFNKDECIFYINHDLTETFMGLVSADVFISSHSTLSYTAALINKGDIFFKKCNPFTPLPTWNIID